MFTGIVEGRADVVEVTHRQGAADIVVEAPAVVEGTAIGDSISVNGCCLTVTAISGARLAFTLGTETLDRTTLAGLQVGQQVNVERALAIGDRLGGHLVQGHVDGVGRVVGVDRQPGHTVLIVELPAELQALVAPKGSITLDGVSLTIAAVEAECRIAVSLIPHTEAMTTLGQITTGDELNVEADLIARHVVTFLRNSQPDSDEYLGGAGVSTATANGPTYRSARGASDPHVARTTPAERP